MNSSYQISLWAASFSILGSAVLGISSPSWGQTTERANPVPQSSDASTIRDLADTGKPGPEVLSSPLNQRSSHGMLQAASDANELPSLFDGPENLFTDYLLGPGDQIQVLVFGYEEFEGPRVVLPDGTINIPLIGTITASGKTLGTLESEIENRLRLYLTDPVVDANLQVLRPVVVNVVGEVYRPGPIQLSSLTTVSRVVRDTGTLTDFTTTPTLSTALTSAGGIRRTADVRDVKILRRLPDGATAEFTINLWEALKGEDDLGVLVMYDGDTVIVPTAPEGSPSIDQSLIARSSIAPANIRVRVIGEVSAPGELQIQPNSSVSSAIAAAGGHDTETAQLSNVKLVRLGENGQVEEQVVDVSNLVDNVQIQDGDVIFVPKRGGINALDNFGRIFSPLLAPFGIINTIDNLLFDNN
jgi:polysaccharide export outer membrane protein